MAFEVKEWTDRQVQYPGRRKLMPTIIENVYDIERAEGTVSEPGNAFDANNMNDLEARIKAALESIRDTDISVMDKNNHFTAEKLDGVLDELFMFASNGKKEFANAIGGSASSTFESLANLASAIKQDRDNGKSLIANAIGGTRNGIASSSESFKQLSNRIKNDKMSFWTGSGSRIPETIIYSNSSRNFSFSINFGFTPKLVFIENLIYEYSGYKGDLVNSTFGISNKKKEEVTFTIDANISSINSSGIILSVKVPDITYLSSNGYVVFLSRSPLIYAFG